MPANIQAVLVCSTRGDQLNWEVRHATESVEVPTTLTPVDPQIIEFPEPSFWICHQLVFGEELTAGESYVIRANRLIASRHQNEQETIDVAVFHTTAPAEIPTTIGELGLADSSEDSLTIESLAGDCAATVNAVHCGVTLELSAEAEPWRDALYFGTFVDGVPWFPRHSMCETVSPGTSWVGRGTDLVFAICGDYQIDVFGRELIDSLPFVLTEGWHTVQIRGWIPGTDVVLTSSQIGVELECQKSLVLPIVLVVSAASLIGVGYIALYRRRRKQNV